MATRRELTARLKPLYQQEERSAKQRLLDEFVSVTGYHRKHAIRVLTAAASVSRASLPP